ncbi:cytochrome b5 domain-containing protein 1-like [Cyrtonyx montezumae]|uniref:cytochrome b5 domain-containing protein 1-like n=1 Tax=Cyrtonyx montezumae TaxID=9017 RepID=UPI0032DA61EA
MAAGGAKRQPRYFTAREVAEAGRPLLSALGRVYDLTPLLRERRGDVTLLPLLDAVGTDISHWFDPESGDPLPRVEPCTGQTSFRYPVETSGSFQPHTPRTDEAPPRDVVWWRDSRLHVGHLTSASRLLRLCNTLTGQNHVIEVCREESLEAALRRAQSWNEHLERYVACYGGVPLSPHLTLEQNGIPDSTSELRSLRLDPKDFIPTVLLYFNDDACHTREGRTSEHPQKL